MAFLDNSGDIILDAVLTDTGRYRLAKGDGSFRITKFALGDDEINYKLYDKNNASGSAYYDLEIMQTPILEAFTNNTSMLQYKLLSIPRTNLLYLPVLKVNNNADTLTAGTVAANQGFAVMVTNETYTEVGSPSGIFNGEYSNSDQVVKIDQGLDTTEISWKYELDQDLKETQYIIEIDSRLGIIGNSQKPQLNATVSFIDDDNIASYYLSQESDPGFITNNKQYRNTTTQWSSETTSLPEVATITGPQGTTLFFKIKTTTELISSNFLFEQIGGTLSLADFKSDWGGSATATGTYKYIDTIMKITGATTGYRLDIPVRFIKKTA